MAFPNPELNNIKPETWDHPSFRMQGINVDVLRLDKIHPEISGNKWFKLKYYLEKARKENKKKLISFGGAYSNHLLALASAARLHEMHSVGFIRGEEPERHSHTLNALRELGMEIHFLGRHDYDKKKSEASDTHDEDPDSLLIPEGGAGEEGRRGAEEILTFIPPRRYEYICTAVGTGTTLAGLINGAQAGQKLIGVSVLKGTRDFEPMNTSWIKNHVALKDLLMIHDDHFGGYAKPNIKLFDFMNQIYKTSGIPTDFVYTGKLFFSVIRMVDLHMFTYGSRILMLHTGGLQGNHSLAPGRLQF